MNRNVLLPIKRGVRRLWYFTSHAVSFYLPNSLYCYRMKRLLASLTLEERIEVEKRVSYYIRIGNTLAADKTCSHLDMSEWTTIGSFRLPKGKKKLSTYFYDLYTTLRCFNSQLRMNYLFGDVTEEPSSPTFVKSRPITEGNSNAVLLKLNQLRHYLFVSDPIPFEDKKDMLVSRNIVRQPHRRLLLERYSSHSMCNVGQVNDDTNFDHPEWRKGYLSISQQLKYKFVCCIEGNDVATNLKWVMSSRSLAVMPRPRYETWFMEGTLVPDYHYVEIKPDYSDLIDKIKYYIAHPDEAEAIIAHAHEYVSQFQNERMERIIQFCVDQRYFVFTGQTALMKEGGT